MFSNSFWEGFLAGAFLVFAGFFAYFVSNRAARGRGQKK